MKREIGGLDLVRFAAAMLVTLFHLGFWVWAFPSGASGRAAGSIPAIRELEPFGTFGWVGVEIFFVISGFVIAFSAASAEPADFARRRFLRLVPAVWLVAPVTALCALFSGSLGKIDSVKLLASSMLFIPFGPWIDSVYWTLGIEVIFYACIWVIIRADSRENIEFFAFFIGGVSTLFWMVATAFQIPNFVGSRVLDLLLVHHGVHFAIGMLIWSVWQSGFTVTRISFFFTFLLGGIIQLIARSNFEAAKTGAVAMPWLPVMAWLLSTMFVILALRFPFGGRMTRTLGLMTYPLYLVHNVAGSALLGVLHRAGVEMLTAVTIVIALALVLSWLVAAFLEPTLRDNFSGLLKLRRKILS